MLSRNGERRNGVKAWELHPFLRIGDFLSSYIHTMTVDQYDLLNKFPKDESYLSEKQLEENCYNDASYEEITDGYNQLDRQGWIDGGIPLPGLRITDKGIKALLDYEEKIKRENEIADLNLKKLRYDVKNAARVYKSYWWTFWFAVIGLVISLSLLILKLRE